MKGEQAEWFGAPATPHVTGDLRKLKAVLNYGKRVDFRRDQQIIWVQQCHEANRRTNPDGVILSVTTVDGVDSPSAQLINKGGALFLSKSGNDRPTLATFSPYRFASDVKEEDPSAMQKMGSVASAVSTRSVTAISYGGGIMAIQGFWWLARHITWLRRPIIIPSAAFVVGLAGLTPSILGNAFLPLIQPIGAFVMQHALRLHKTLLGDPWFWFIPALLLLVGWCCCRHTQGWVPESEDVPNRYQKKIVPSPLSGPSTPPSEVTPPLRAQFYQSRDTGQCASCIIEMFTARPIKRTCSIALSIESDFPGMGSCQSSPFGPFFLRVHVYVPFGTG